MKPISFFALAALPLSSWAFGVGDVELQSRYAQPLSARVPITLTDPSEVVQPSDLSVRLLPPSAYESMGLTPPPILPDALTLNVSGSGQAFWVELESRQAIREPYMTLLLEVRVAGVRIVRELPFLFDLPVSAPASTQVAAQSPAAQPVASVPAAVVSVEPATDPAQPPAATPETLASAPVNLLPANTPAVQPRVIIRRAPKKVVAAASEPQPKPKSTFQLAGWNQTGLAPKVLMPRFQLAPSFDSYTKLAQAGAAPLPATSLATAPAVVELTPPAVMAPESPAETRASREGSGLGMYWWGLFAAAVAAAVLYLRRRRASQDTAQVISMGQVVAVPENAMVDVVQTPATVETVEAAIQQPPLVVVPTPASPPVATIEPSPAVAAVLVNSPADIKKRLADLTVRVSGDANLLRKAQLVGAYIDLNRMESAESLLSELETETSGGGRPKISLIRG